MASDLDHFDRESSDKSDGDMCTSDEYSDPDTVLDRAGTPSDATKRLSTNTQLSRRLFLSSGERREPLRNVSNAHSSNSADTDTQRLILEELKKTNSRLDKFSEHLEAMDDRLKSVEQFHLSSTTPSSSASSEGSVQKTKRKVPTKVAMTVRDVYKALLDEDENFMGYDPKKRFTDQDVVSRLVSEAGKLDCNIPVIQLRDAARRFYQTTIEITALKDKGKYDAKVTQQRRRNRLKRKLDIRQSIVLKSSSVTDTHRDALKKIMVKEFISSEESGEEVVDGERRAIMLVKPLSWRASRVERIFKQLDRKADKNKTKQSKQQTLPRAIGPMSTRPIGFGDDFWGFAEN